MSLRRPDTLLQFLYETWPEGQVVLLRQVSAIAANLGLPLYAVGGVVRDLLLGKSSPDLDLDLMVEGEAGQLAQALKQRFGGKWTRHPRFHTAKWELDKGVWERLGYGEPAGIDSLDFVTARTETYAHPAALPDVTPATVKDDLRRRDITINAMALRLNGPEAGQFIDHFNGLQDLEAGLVRVLHERSFQDDPTRLFRVARFACRFGFDLVPETDQQFRSSFQYLDLLTGERIRHEFEAIWREDEPATTMRHLHQVGMLTTLHPDLVWQDEMTRANRRLRENGAAHGISLWFTHFALPVRSALSQRWLLPGHWQQMIEATAGLVAGIAALSPEAAASELYEQIHAAAKVDGALALAASRLDPVARGYLQQYQEEWSRLVPFLDGHDLQRLGVPAGPIYKTILTTLFAKQLDGELDCKESAEIAALELSRQRQD